MHKPSHSYDAGMRAPYLLLHGELATSVATDERNSSKYWNWEFIPQGR
jgi:hypothetical protein